MSDPNTEQNTDQKSEKPQKLTAFGEPFWKDVLKSMGCGLMLLALTIVVGGALGVAIMAPWGRANFDCSIYCVIRQYLSGSAPTSDLVEKPQRPNPFSGYEREIRFAKDWYRLSDHKRALVVAHWSHEAGFTKTQNSTLIWCLKSMAEATDAKLKEFDEAKNACMDKVKASKPKG